MMLEVEGSPGLGREKGRVMLRGEEAKDSSPIPQCSQLLWGPGRGSFSTATRDCLSPFLSLSPPPALLIPAGRATKDKE